MLRAASKARLGAALAAAAIAAGACGPNRSGTRRGAEDGDESRAGADRPAGCPALARAPAPLPGVSREAESRDYWLERTGQHHDLDEALLSPREVRALNAALAEPREGYSPQRDLAAAPDLEKLRGEVTDRIEFFTEKVSSDALERAEGGAPSPDAVGAHDFDAAGAELRVALESLQIRCFPYPEPLYEDAADPRFDRNACSSAHPQELVRVVAGWPNGMKLVETRFAFGWIEEGAPLSPPLEGDARDAFARGPSVRVEAGPLRGEEGASSELSEIALLPAAGDQRVYFADEGGVHRTRPIPERLRETPRPITRRAVLEEAFSFLGSPYGFGGKGGGRDCSRFLLDLFGRFGVRLPRHSSWQARAGTFSIDVSEADEDARRQIIDAAHDRGVVLLHFPGHIMLYLGRDEDGAQMAIHSLGEYADRCEDLPEDEDDLDTIRRVERVVVSDLELGRGSARTSFIERLNRVTVLGKPPGPALAGIAEVRPPAPASVPSWEECRGGDGAALFVSPEKPNRKQPLRVVATSSENPRPSELVLVDPEGERHRPELVSTGGPPYGLVATLDEPAPGRWRAVLGDGERVLGCQRIRVRRYPSRPRQLSGDGPVWKPRRRWTRATENLYAVFIERLFDYPLGEEEQTWPSLQPILRDRDRNILAGHLRPGDDGDLNLKADCADLPYTLRAYFSWKMRLPFAYRACRRARNGRPPACNARGGDNLMSRAEFPGSNEAEIFEFFANRRVRRTVHSSSARTLPEDEATDYYPVELTREGLKPGTLFADPYGHLLVVVDWVPQTLDEYGVLVAADAQPDGTVGRRRFWRGSFLFQPETGAGGAGFKAFRPRVVSQQGGAPVLENIGNRRLTDSRHFAPFALEQYEGTAEDFYRRLEALINPRPLDPFARQVALIDAFEEQVGRRVISIENGEEFMKKRNYRPIEMPRGASIFLTSGPWEDYSTPSRDLRLLIALDTTVEFPDRVEASPERFAIPADQVEEKVAELRKAMREELESREITYTRSDGSEATLTLAQIVDRQKLLEMAYNPNDCIEVRWLAPEGSEEMETCERRAPREQQRRMAEYREWFITRSRPAN